PFVPHRQRRRQDVRVDPSHARRQLPDRDRDCRDDQADRDVFPPSFQHASTLHYLTPRLFLASSSRSVLTHSFAAGGFAMRPTPVLYMMSVVIWMCSGVMS